MDAAGVTRTYFTLEGLPSGEPPKGFLCGPPRICAETENPVNGRWSFDNILAALMQVTVTASSNTWTDGMYAMMSADYFASFLFYVAGVLIINYWCVPRQLTPPSINSPGPFRVEPSSACERCPDRATDF